MTRARQVAPLLMLAVLLLAAAARFHRLDAQSLWYDEGITAAHALRSLPELIPRLQVNVHTPAYFVLIAAWEDIAGASELALRLPSALFSLLGIAWAFALGKRLYGGVAGLAAAALIALNTFSIEYAQEARMYGMLTAIAGASIWLFAGVLQGRSRRRDVAAYALVNALGVYTQVVFALVMLGQALAMALWLGESLLRQPPSVPPTGQGEASPPSVPPTGQGEASPPSVPPTGQGEASIGYPLRPDGEGLGEGLPPMRTRSDTLGARAVWRVFISIALANTVAVLLFLPWLPHSLLQVFSRPNRAQVVAADEVLALISGHFAFGGNYAHDMGLAWVAIVALLVAGVMPLRGRGKWRIVLPIAWLFVSVFPYVALELTTRYFRFLLPAQMGLALLAGRGLWVLWQGGTENTEGGTEGTESRDKQGLTLRAAGAAAIGAILWAMLAGLPTFYQHSDFQRDDMRGLAAGMEADMRAGDGVIFSAPGLVDLLSYYYDGHAPTYALPSTRDDAQIRAETLDIIAAHGRLHVILYGAREQDPRRIVEDTLNRHAHEISDEWVGDLRYLRYASASALGDAVAAGWSFGGEIALDSYALSADSVAAGETLLARLDWKAQATIDERYAVALQLLDSAGRLVAQRDSQPAGGAQPTSSWQAGEIVIDRHALAIPADLPAGEHSLILALYDAANPLARLPVNDADHVVLGAIQVLPRS